MEFQQSFDVLDLSNEMVSSDPGYQRLVIECCLRDNEVMCTSRVGEYN